jgi:uncharacterized membrane protein YqaE (UPF0057 family)
MRYLCCFLLPPLAVLSTGRWISAVLNLFFTLLFILPGVVHAFLVVNRYYADRRHAEMLAALKTSATPPQLPVMRS